MNPELARFLCAIAVLIGTIIGAAGGFGVFHFSGVISDKQREDDILTRNTHQSDAIKTIQISSTETQSVVVDASKSTTSNIVSAIKETVAAQAVRDAGIQQALSRIEQSFVSVSKSEELSTNESYPGFTIFVVATLRKQQVDRRKYIVDIGTVKKNRLSVYIAEDDSLIFAVTDQTGEKYILRVLSKDVPFGEVSNWIFELSQREQKTTLRILLDGKPLVQTTIDYRIETTSFNSDNVPIIWAADLNRTNFMSMVLSSAVLIRNQTLTTDAQLKIMRSIIDLQNEL